MRCETYSENLTAYMDGELDERSRLELEKHLAVCVRCQNEYDLMRTALAFVERNVTAVKPRPEIWQNIQARIRPQRLPIWRRVLSGISQPIGWAWQTPARAFATALALSLTIAGIGFHLHYRNDLNMEQHRVAELTGLMESYVQSRDWEELRHQNPFYTPASCLHDEYAQNPFLLDEKNHDENPFKL